MKHWSLGRWSLEGFLATVKKRLNEPFEILLHVTKLDVHRDTMPLDFLVSIIGLYQGEETKDTGIPDVWGFVKS